MYEQHTLTTIGIAAGGIIILTITTYVFYRSKSKPVPPPTPKRKHHKPKSEIDRILSDISMRQTIPDAVQAKKKEDIIILHELQLGESYMMNGNYEEGTRHLANAVSMYSNPEKFLRTLRGCLDPAIYKMLISTLVNGHGARQPKFPYDPFEKYIFSNPYCYLPK